MPEPDAIHVELEFFGEHGESKTSRTEFASYDDVRRFLDTLIASFGDRPPVVEVRIRGRLKANVGKKRAKRKRRQ